MSRRRFATSVRSLTLLVALAAVVLGWLAVQREKVRREREALAELQRIQGRLTAPRDFWIDQPVSVQSWMLPWWLALGGAPGFSEVTAVSFDLRSYDDGFEEDVRIGDVEMRIISEFSSLRALEVPRSDVGDPGLEQLRSLGKLEELDLTDTRITDEGLRHLRHLSSLRSLTLDHLPLSGKGLRYLAQCPKLQRLSLQYVPLSSEHAGHINAFKTLERLRVRSATLDQVHLHDLPVIRELFLELPSNHQAIRIERMPRLENLSIQLSQAGVPQRVRLADLPNLKTLAIGWAETASPSDGRPRLEVEGVPGLEQLSVRWRQMPDDLLPILGRLTSVRELWIDCDGAALHDKTIPCLTRLTHLQDLQLVQTSLGDAGLAALCGMPSLEQLSLASGQITETGLLELKRLSRLKTLNLRSIRSRIDCGRMLLAIPQLQTLGLESCQFPKLSFVCPPPAAAPDLKHPAPIADQPRSPSLLSTITLANCAIHAVELRGLSALKEVTIHAPPARRIHVADLPRLERLDISFDKSQIVEQFELAGLPQLRWLSLQCGAEGARLPPDAFANLRQCPRLRDGIIWGLDLSEQARKDLEQFHRETGVGF